jgi:peroxiredoxin Q/BCP
MKAPDFKLKDQDGTWHSLASYSGKWVVLYFYPKNDTPGCTTEACAFRDERDAIAEYGNAVVVGISKDSVISHKKFADKHQLNFTLLSDETGDTIKAYNAWGQKSMFGKAFMGIVRSTFIIDPSGNIVKEYPKVSPQGHATQIIRDLQELQT